MQISEPKKKTAAAAGDQTLDWLLLKQEKLIGFWAVNQTTLFRQISLQIGDRAKNYGENQLYTGVITSDSGLSVILKQSVKDVSNARLYFEDCESGDLLIGRLFYE